MKARLILLLSICLTSSCAEAQIKNKEIGSFPQQIDTSEFIYKNKLLPIPLIALSTETNWVFGIGGAYIFKTSKKDPNLRTSTMPSLFLYTLNDQILIGLGANIFLPRERYIIRFENTFSRFPDKFWGIGNSAPEGAVETYTFTQFYVNPQVSRKVRKNLFAGIGFELQDVFKIRYDSGGNFAKDKVLGIYNRTSYHVLGYSLLLTYDSRIHAYSPNKGAMFRLKYSNFGQVLGSDYQFQSVDVDFRRFIELRPNRILAVQALGQFAFGDVPYRNLAVLGGSMMMRGYYGGRYRDKMFIGAQAEYRFPIYRRFGGVAFVSAGQVGGSLSEFNSSQFHYAGGGGIRFAVLRREKLNLRFDVAYGNSVNYYVVLAESF